MQSRIDSWIEATVNTAVGFIISWLMWVLVIGPMFHIHATPAVGLGIVLLFTITSILRSYIIRRLFTGRSVRRAFLRYLRKGA